MKIFAIYIKIKLLQKPEWFDEFLKKYFEPVSLHITLIQPRYVGEEQIEDLKTEVRLALEKIRINYHDKKILFESLEIDEGSDGKCTFMLNSTDNTLITLLQKELMSVLKNYNNYVGEHHKEYEVNFKPHITVAAVDETLKVEALKYFSSSFKFEGVLEELVLPIVKNQSIAERTNTNNQNTFKL